MLPTTDQWGGAISPAKQAEDARGASMVADSKVQAEKSGIAHKAALKKADEYSKSPEGKRDAEQRAWERRDKSTDYGYSQSGRGGWSKPASIFNQRG